MPEAADLDNDDRRKLAAQLYKVVWLGETDATARDLARARTRKGGDDTRMTVNTEADADWLRDYLGERVKWRGWSVRADRRPYRGTRGRRAYMKLPTSSVGVPSGRR